MSGQVINAIGYRESPSYLKRPISLCISLTILLLMLLLDSCQEDIDPITCSCNSNGTELIQAQPGIIINTLDGFRFLDPVNGYYVPCHPLSNDVTIDGLLVTLSGTNKSSCLQERDANKIQKESHAVISGVTIISDSTFNNSNFKITIIKSENYGYSQGFGYRIDHVDNFDVLQPTIPGVEGYVPFETKSDALKVAVLVAYLLNQHIGLPSVTLNDLDYLKINGLP
jgi:hypothetical protein